MTRFTIKRYNDGELAAESCLGSQDLNPIRQTERSVWEGCQEIQEFHGSCRIASKGEFKDLLTFFVVTCTFKWVLRLNFLLEMVCILKSTLRLNLMRNLKQLKG